MIHEIFMLAIWNGYDRETAIERAILSQMKDKTDKLPELLAEKLSHVKIADASTIEKDFAKTLMSKSVTYIGEKFQAGKAVGAEVNANVSHMPQIFSKVGEFASQVGDEVTLLVSHGETIYDLAKGRISKKQAAKNLVVGAVGIAGTAIAVSTFPVGGAVATFFIGFGGKIGFREKARKILDGIIKSDAQEMLELFEIELVKSLDGKFLTQYERELLAEALHDALNNDVLKDMYAGGDNDTARAKWAHDFIAWRLEEIFAQRIFVEMPSVAEWNAGIRRVMQALNDGEDIAANMERKRTEILQKRRAFLAGYKLKPYELAPVVRAVNAMNKTQLAAERALKQMQDDESRYRTNKQRLDDDWASLSAALDEF